MDTVYVKEENGLLLRLPCKVGDKIYIISKPDKIIIPIVIEEIRINEYGVSFLYDGCFENYKSIDIECLKEDVFLTMEEAQQKLKEIRGGAAKLHR